MYSVTVDGVLKKIETWQVIIPLHDNSGVAFEEATIESILDQITLTFPGLTMINCAGRWRGKDRVYIDKNLQVLIDALPLSSEASASWLRTAPRWEYPTRASTRSATASSSGSPAPYG